MSRNQRTAADYFLGARDLPGWAILLSIVATETSALTVISVPAIAARGDLTFLQLPLGYLIGRVAVAEYLPPSPALRRAISVRLPLDELRDVALGHGLVPLRAYALALVNQGLIPFTELPLLLSPERLAPHSPL